MMNHSAAFKVGYYTKDGLPPDAVVSWLPENSTADYLVRFDTPCKSGIKVTLCECCTPVPIRIPSKSHLQIMRPRFCSARSCGTCVC